MAKKFWPGEDALGKQVNPPIFKNATIVGIVADTKHLSLREEPAPEMYVPYTQKVWPSLLTMDVVVRSNLDPTALETSLRAAVTSVDPELPIANVMTLSAIVNNSMTQRRFALLVLSSFAALAMLLAAIGMYGVISYSVFRRVQEIGVRMALGAQRSSIFLMILGEAGRLLLAAFAIGIACSFAVNRTIASFLFGVRPTDPLTFAAVSVCMSAVVLVACYLPARRAMAIQPMLALRYE
jgi:putative ABC transport system permease protein